MLSESNKTEPMPNIRTTTAIGSYSSNLVNVGEPCQRG